MSNGFDMEQAAKDACAKFDREHGSEDNKQCDNNGTHLGSNEPVYDADGYTECPCGCKAKTHRDMLEQHKKELADRAKGLIGSTITAEIKSVPNSDKAGVVVSLPESREQAYLLLLGIVNTMSMAGGESFDEIIAEMSRLNSAGAMAQGEKYTP